MDTRGPALFCAVGTPATAAKQPGLVSARERYSCAHVDAVRAAAARAGAGFVLIVAPWGMVSDGAPLPLPEADAHAGTAEVPAGGPGAEETGGAAMRGSRVEELLPLVLSAFGFSSYRALKLATFCRLQLLFANESISVIQ